MRGAFKTFVLVSVAAALAPSVARSARAAVDAEDVDAYEADLKVYQHQADTACKARGVSDTRGAIADSVMKKVDEDLDDVRDDIQDLKTEIDAPVTNGPPLQPPKELETARAELRREVDKLERVMFDRKYRRDNGVTPEQQRARVVNARQNVEVIEKGYLEALKTPVPITAEARAARVKSIDDGLTRINQLADLSDRFQSLRSDIRFCKERAAGFPGQPASPYIDSYSAASGPAAGGPGTSSASAPGAPSAPSANGNGGTAKASEAPQPPSSYTGGTATNFPAGSTNVPNPPTGP